MGCNVFANGDEIACKAGGGKVIAAFPDVCLTPPPPPAGPIPVPYPNTSFSKDMKEGSKTVTIKGEEVMLKDASYYKSSPLGDEAATNSQGAGVVTHVITGKTYFVAWSMDVKFEGQNVDRHTDLTTSNHASPMANASVPMINASEMAAAGPAEEDPCAKAKARKKNSCGTPENPAPWRGVDTSPSRSKKMLGRVPCSKINEKIAGIEECLAARQAVTDACFGGVTDEVHRVQEDQLRTGLKNARDLAALNCKPGHPMAGK